MYALPPGGIRRSVDRMPGDRRLIGTLIAVVASAAGYIWIGKTIGDWLIYLLDRQTYLESRIEALRAELSELETELEQVMSNVSIAEQHDPSAIISDNDNGPIY